MFYSAGGGRVAYSAAGRGMCPQCQCAQLCRGLFLQCTGAVCIYRSFEIHVGRQYVCKHCDAKEVSAGGGKEEVEVEGEIFNSGKSKTAGVGRG